jgi:hypothetical protein
VGDLFEDFFSEKITEDGSPLGGTRAAEAAALAAGRDQEFGPAVRAPDAGEALLKIATTREGEDRVFDERSPEPIGALEAVVPDTFDLLVSALHQAKHR